jgi:hypothetical protein
MHVRFPAGPRRLWRTNRSKQKIRLDSGFDLRSVAAMNPKYLPIRASEGPFFGPIRAANMPIVAGQF